MKVRAYYDYYDSDTDTIRSWEEFDLGFGVTAAPGVIVFP